MPVSKRVSGYIVDALVLPTYVRFFFIVKIRERMILRGADSFETAVVHVTVSGARATSLMVLWCSVNDC